MGLTTSLAAFANANDVASGVFGVSNILAVTPGAEFTTISEQPSGESTLADLFAEFMANNPAISATWRNKNGAVLGVELRTKNGP